MRRVRAAPHPDPRYSRPAVDRKSTRLNSSHRCISYAVFCLKKKMLDAEQVKRLAAGLPLDELHPAAPPVPLAPVNDDDEFPPRLHGVTPTRPSVDMPLPQA